MGSGKRQQDRRLQRGKGAAAFPANEHLRLTEYFRFLDFSSDYDLEGLTLEGETTAAEIRTPRLRGVQRSLSERSLTTKAY